MFELSRIFLFRKRWMIRRSLTIFVFKLSSQETMKKIWVALVFGTAFLVNSCQENKNNNGVIAKDLSAKEVQALLAERKDIQLLDVRTPEEYASGHLPNARLVDISRMATFKETLEKMDKNKAAVVYCAVGGRSSRAKNILTEMGFKEVYNLSGGIMAWQNNGLPIER